MECTLQYTTIIQQICSDPVYVSACDPYHKIISITRIMNQGNEFCPLTNPLPTFTTNQGIILNIFPYITPYSLWNHSGYYEQLPVWST